MRTKRLLLMLVPLVLIVGCARQHQEQPSAGPEIPPIETDATQAVEPSSQGPASEDGGKVRITAYINVTSECQADTVALVNNLGIDYADLVDLEIVDFGSPDGEKRWKGDGMDCMTILFNDSPVLQFPGEDGQTKTVVFFMPAGFDWTHEDLEVAFAAIKDGTLKILTREEAERELAPRPVEIETSVREIDGGAEVILDGETVIAVKAEGHGETPLERAKAAKQAIDQWAEGPIHPSQLQVEAQEDAAAILAGDVEIIQVTPEDAEAAGTDNHKKLANKWLRGIKKGAVEAVRRAQQQ